MRHAIVGLILLGATAILPANAAVNVSIGINVPAYPTLVRIPSYPVYYAPSLRANYFFYDGLYWVFSDGVWYESPWYNGPWEAVDPYDVPVYLLRVPVRYYRFAPAYFHAWAYDAPPLWGSVWGSTWESRRSGWNRWDRRYSPAAAPLPVYQRSYSGSRYPVTVAQQATIASRSYSYQPRETIARQAFQQRRAQAQVTAPQQRSFTQAAPTQTQARREAFAERRAVEAQPQQRFVQRQERAQQERAQQAQAQRQEQRGERQAQHENRGRGKDHDRRDNG